MLAKETVALLAEHYASAQDRAPPVTVSAINLEALVPVAQALDTFSVVYLQWLSNDVIWRARESVVNEPHECPGALAGATTSTRSPPRSPPR